MNVQEGVLIFPLKCQHAESCAVFAIRLVSLAMQLEALRQENAQLRAQLDAERRSSSKTTSTSSRSPAYTQSGSSKSSLAPPVSVKPLAFPVSSFIAVGEAAVDKEKTGMV